MNKKEKAFPLLKNKKAYFLYTMVETIECGVVLKGHEVKAVKARQVEFTDSYARITKNDEVLLYNMHLAPYKFAPLEEHHSLRPRKLLLHKAEIRKLKRKSEQKGLSLVPTAIYLKNSLIKVALALAKGKKLHQKKEAIKERSLDREMRQEAKRFMKE